MPTVQLEIQQELYDQLQKVAQKTHQNQDQLLKQAMAEGIEDLLDAFEAQQALQEHHATGGETTPLEDLI